jgi:gamma-tubulin complex component 3
MLLLIAVEALFMADPEGDLRSMMDSAYLETSRRVLDVLAGQYKFLDHLQALRRYLLLGQGDFIRHLMELLELVPFVFHKNLSVCIASKQIRNF